MLIRGWSAAPDLVWTHYDDSDEWVVFDPRCGDVHLVSAAAHELWQLVDQSPSRSSDELIAALASRLNRPADRDLASVTAETLEFMDRTGLIRPVVQ